ncbi:MAG: dehydrogenase, partial [Firmicutes bacterium]|nr:dehydrogenase [Bacillota bacterium]
RMEALFDQLWPLPESAQVETFRSLIEVMAQKATDQQYIQLCETNQSLAAALPSQELRRFLDARAKATAMLPKALVDRDAQLMKKALTQAPASVQKILMQAMSAT